MLLNAGIDNFFIVVEKFEKFDYMLHFPVFAESGARKILPLPMSHCGTSSIARNFCLNHAAKNGHKKLWMLDDDITRVFAHNQGKNINWGVQEIFEELEKIADSPINKKVMAMGLRTSASFLKQVKKSEQRNCSLSSIYLLTVDNFRFRGIMLVDMDYQLQILRAGFETLRMENFAFSFITPTKIKGGYYDIYTDDEKRRKAINLFLKYNPDVDPEISRNTTGFLVLKNISKIWRKFK